MKLLLYIIGLIGLVITLNNTFADTIVLSAYEYEDYDYSGIPDYAARREYFPFPKQPIMGTFPQNFRLM